MSHDDIHKAVLQGEFKEAKWTQTVSMALLWLAANEGDKK